MRISDWSSDVCSSDLPDFEVERLAGRKAHVAGAQQDAAIGQAELLQDIFGGIHHALVLRLRLLGRGDGDELDLVELMLADHAARVAAGRARLRPEAGDRKSTRLNSSH